MRTLRACHAQPDRQHWVEPHARRIVGTTTPLPKSRWVTRNRSPNLSARHGHPLTAPGTSISIARGRHGASSGGAELRLFRHRLYSPPRRRGKTGGAITTTIFHFGGTQADCRLSEITAAGTSPGGHAARPMARAGRSFELRDARTDFTARPGRGSAGLDQGPALTGTGSDRNCSGRLSTGGTGTTTRCRLRDLHRQFRREVERRDISDNIKLGPRRPTRDRFIVSSPA